VSERNFSQIASNRFTGSDRAAELLRGWSEAVEHFWHIVPKTEVARISSVQEGTVASGKA